jgi:hypothetical protein
LEKVLALVGRLEVRGWIDVIECDQRLQPLGYLAWAACGKDPGFSPAAILEHASRTARTHNRRSTRSRSPDRSLTPANVRAPGAPCWRRHGESSTSSRSTRRAGASSGQGPSCTEVVLPTCPRRSRNERSHFTRDESAAPYRDWQPPNSP